MEVVVEVVSTAAAAADVAGAFDGVWDALLPADSLLISSMEVMLLGPPLMASFLIWRMTAVALYACCASSVSQCIVPFMVMMIMKMAVVVDHVEAREGKVDREMERVSEREREREKRRGARIKKRRESFGPQRRA